MTTLKKILFYFFLVVVLSWILDLGIQQGIRSNRSGLYDKFNKIFQQQNNYNLLIVGSSRAECHFNPAIIDSLCGYNSFNIGVSGSNNSFTYGIYKTYLSKSAAPKVVVMNIDFHFAHESSDTIYEFPRFFPYLNNELLFDELKKRDERFYLFKYLPFYKLCFMGDKYLNISARGYINKPGIYDTDCYKGFQAINPIQFKNLSTEDAGSYKASVLQENRDYLDSIIVLSRKNNSKLVFVVSPTYIKGINRIVNQDEQIGVFESIAKKNDIPFLDYTDDPICSDSTLFADFYHMKKEGAQKFSLMFGHDLDSLLTGK